MLALGRVKPAHEQDSLGVVPVKRAVAAAAHVVGSAPVDELEAKLSGHEHVARVRRSASADQSRPRASG